MDIIDKIKLLIPEEIKSKRTPDDKKAYGNKYYRINKKKVLKKKHNLDTSGEGKIRKRMKKIRKKSRKTPVGRHKVEYNV